MECIMVVTSTAFSSLGNWSVIIASIVGSWGSWGKPLHWQISSLWFCREVFFGAGGGLGENLKWQTQFIAVVIVACIAHMCLAKKFCLDLGVLGENALTNSIYCCYVCV